MLSYRDLVKKLNYHPGRIITSKILQPVLPSLKSILQFLSTHIAISFIRLEHENCRTDLWSPRHNFLHNHQISEPVPGATNRLLAKIMLQLDPTLCHDW